MKTFKLKEDEEYITLGQLLKAAGLVDNGGQAKADIQAGLVEVNGEIETRRGKKLRAGDTVRYDGSEVTVAGC